jgi:predicted nucleotidyltransferase
MSPFITEQVAAMLKAIEPVLQQFDIDFYVVGAIARDIQLGEFAHARKTNDVDLAIRVGDEKQFNALKAALVETGDFTAHKTEAIKLFYKKAIEVDLLPFGEIEGENRDVTLHEPKLFQINMPGFKEIYPYVEWIELEDVGGLKICSLEGLVLLKLIAYDDRPARTKDITDIDHILKYFFEINQDDIYEDHFDLMDIYDTRDKDYLALVGAHVIGRKLKKIIGEDQQLRERILKILDKRPTHLWGAISSSLK